MQFVCGYYLALIPFMYFVSPLYLYRSAHINYSILCSYAAKHICYIISYQYVTAHAIDSAVQKF